MPEPKPEKLTAFERQTLQSALTQWCEDCSTDPKEWRAIDRAWRKIRAAL